MGLDLNSMNASLVHQRQSETLINPIQQRIVVPKFVTIGQQPDYLVKNSDLEKYISEKAVTEMIKANPQVVKILQEVDLPVRINRAALNELKKNHLPHTKQVVMGIISNLPKEFKNNIDFRPAIQAAPLHDVGKVIIPSSILHKGGRLSEDEFEIMQKHSTLGYELLKTTDLDKKTLELIKNHHQNAQKTGYPSVEENFVSDLNLQILSVADVYSALREKRSYKDEMTKNQALSIIHKQMKQGEIHPYVFKAIVDYANQEEGLYNLKPKGQILNSEFENRLRA